MPTLPIVSTFANFLTQSSHAPLQLTFAHLEIHNHRHGHLFNRVQRHRSRIILHKTSQKGLAELTVVDNLVFSFSFQFHLPQALKFQEVEMLSLPRPLDSGRLQLDEEKLQLSFRIDAPDPSLRIHVTLVYQGILELQRIYTPLCGTTRPLHR